MLLFTLHPIIEQTPNSHGGNVITAYERHFALACGVVNLAFRFDCWNVALCEVI